MDAVLLARLQFAMTVGFHFLFPPITIGLAWLLVVVEALGWRRGDEAYERLGKFFGRILGLTFAVVPEPCTLFTISSARTLWRSRSCWPACAASASS